MRTSQAHISPDTPMGATLVGGGATFRVWAPGAKQVYVVFNGKTNIVPQATDELLKNDTTGHWTGFISGVTDGSLYRFWIVGPGGQGLKRDPYARELELHGWPEVDCIVRDPQRCPGQRHSARANGAWATTGLTCFPRKWITASTQTS